MEDNEEDVVFKGSPLDSHLELAGFDCEDVSPVTMNRYSDGTYSDTATTILQPDIETTDCNIVKEDGESSENYDDMTCKKRYKFSLKLFLLGVSRWLLGINAWELEAKQHLEQFAFNVNEDIFNASVLEEDDSEFVDKFSRSMRDRFADSEEDNFGEYFKHGAIFVVVLGYGIGRAIQINRTGVAGMNTWAVDVIVVGLMVCILLPSVVKIVFVEKFKQKLKMARRKTLVHLTEIARCFILLKKALRLIQEAEVINRGFTLAEVRSSVMSGEPQKKSDKLTQRQYPALRETIFKHARSVMLSAKMTANKLLDVYPLQNKLEGGPEYLCLLDISQYGPCVTEDIGSDQLYKTTDGYALAANKGIVGLCHSQVSEWLRIVSVYCLLASQESPKDFDRLFPVLDTLHQDLTKSVTHLEYSFLLHKSSLVNESEKKPRDQKEGIYKDISVAINSLTLHVKSAFYRLQKLEDKLEEVGTPGAETLPAELVTNLTSHLNIVHCDLDACQECWTESMKRINGERQTVTATVVKPECNPEASEESPRNEATVLISGDPPLVEDQVFEAYTDPNEPLETTETATLLTQEEKEKRQQEKEEAVRMLKELKSVINLRAEDTRQREARAISRMKTTMGQSETVQSVTGFVNCSESETERNQNESQNINVVNNQDKTCISKFQEEKENQCVPKSKILQESPRNMCSYETEETEAAGISVSSTEENDNACEIAKVFTADVDERDDYDDEPWEESKRLDTNLSLKEKLEKIHGGSYALTSSIATLAAVRSQQMTPFSVDTFGDDSD